MEVSGVHGDVPGAPVFSQIYDQFTGPEVSLGVEDAAGGISGYGQVHGLVILNILTVGLLVKTGGQIRDVLFAVQLGDPGFGAVVSAEIGQAVGVLVEQAGGVVHIV